MNTNETAAPVSATKTKGQKWNEAMREAKKRKAWKESERKWAFRLRRDPL